jgi:biotin synthase
VENIGDLQPLAVKAGLNGVMMGNFLTTLGNTPEQDRKMFEDLGLNIARHEDNGSNPRPDNRSGWLEGETPDVIETYVDTRAEAEAAGLEIKLWDPASQLRFAKREKVIPPRPDGAVNRWPAPKDEELAASGLPHGL